MPTYIWNVIKNTTRAERLSCAAAMVALLLCTALIIYFTVVTKNGNKNVNDRVENTSSSDSENDMNTPPDIVNAATIATNNLMPEKSRAEYEISLRLLNPSSTPHEWNITREMWLARPAPPNTTTQDRFSPIKLVIVQHTVSPECHQFKICAAEIRNLQSYYMDSSHLGYDLPYNFVIGNEGRVYQVRGWNREGAHTARYNRCSIGVGFIGDYREDRNMRSRVTDLQLKRLQMLLQEGVDRGFLRPDYSLLGARDVQNTASPGENLYRALQKLDHYDTTSYRNRTCEQIEQIINAQD